MKNVIEQYVKKNVNGKRQHVGILTATTDGDGTIHFGWSKASVTKGDIFDPQLAREIAIGRLSTSLRGKPITDAFPRSMKKEMFRFQDRCKRYFKDYVAMAVGELSLVR